MNKKGEITTGYIIVLAIALIFGLVMIVPIGQNTGTLTNIGNSSNVSFTMPANGTTADLVACGQLNTSNVEVYNVTRLVASNVTTANYTITQAAGTTGYITTRITCNQLGGANYFCGYSALATCQFEPFGYNHDASSRSIAGLILIMVCIVLIAVGLRKDLFEF